MSKIHEAFSDEKICCKSNFLVNQTWEHLNSEKRLVVKLFKNKHWQEISLEAVIAANLTPLVWFDNQAFNYYLPMYMTLIVEYYDDFGGFLPADCLIDELIPPKRLPSTEGQNDDYLHRTKRFEGLQNLTDEQKKCIKLFLEFMDKEYSDDFFEKDYSFGEIEETSYILPSPALALELYWSQI
ncbi:MAG: DUF6714 family protein [Waterburya sp.]